MRRYALFALAFIAVAGCSWTPERDNPVDPKSRFYSSHDQPRIDSLWMNTEFHYGSFENYYGFEVTCRIADRDHLLKLDSIMVRLDTIPLGAMIFDPARAVFSMRRLQYDLPDGSLRNLVGKPIWVTTHDALDRVDSLAVEFHEPASDPRPIQVHPIGDNPWELNSLHPRLGWQYWGGPVGTHRFEVSVLYRDLVTVWDSTALMPSDTFVVVTRTLLDAGLSTGNWYSWYLTVINPRGDRIVSSPGFFMCFAPDTFAPLATQPEAHP